MLQLYCAFFHFDSFCLEEISEPVDLLLKLPDELAVGVLVDHSLADDLLRAIRVPNERKKEKF